MSIDRRKLMAAGGVAFFAGGGTGAHGAEITPIGGGLTIMIHKSHKGWVVAVPDWDAANESHTAQHPETFIMPIKWMPIDEFLKAFEEPTASCS